MGGDISGEDPRSIINGMNKSRNNLRVQLYLSLYNEALREQRLDFIYFRCWNLLETIARSKNYGGTPYLDWHGKQEITKKGKPRVIDGHALELVRELVRRIFIQNKMNEQSLASGLSQGNIDQQLKIWYRHRNCIAHQGGCFPNNSSLCDQSKQEFIDCKLAHDEIVTNTGAYDAFNDQYLRNLKEVLKIVTFNELK